MRRRSEVVGGAQATIENGEAPSCLPKDRDPAPPPGLQIVSHHGTGPALTQGFERIVERVFDLPDPLAEYDRLERELKLGDQRTDYGSLQKALDSAEDNARIAHKL